MFIIRIIRRYFNNAEEKETITKKIKYFVLLCVPTQMNNVSKKKKTVNPIN